MCYYCANFGAASYVQVGKEYASKAKAAKTPVQASVCAEQGTDAVHQVLVEQGKGILWELQHLARQMRQVPQIDLCVPTVSSDCFQLKAHHSSASCAQDHVHSLPFRTCPLIEPMAVCATAEACSACVARDPSTRYCTSFLRRPQLQLLLQPCPLIPSICAMADCACEISAVGTADECLGTTCRTRQHC